MATIKNKLHLFREIEDKKIQNYLQQKSISLKCYKSGKTLYNQGEQCETLTIIIEGTASAYSLNENGSALTVFDFKEGHMIGANLLFGNQHDYPFNIYCVSDCQLLHIQKEAVCGLLQDEVFMMEYIRYLSLNSQGMNQKIKMLTQNTLKDNLLNYLRNQAQLQQSQTVVLPISKKELADFLGVQRPSLFRELKKLKEEKIIHIDKRNITLLK